MIEILVKTWDYTCGDGCCYEEGTNIYVNGVQVDAPWNIDIDTQAFESFIAALGVDANVTFEHESYDCRVPDYDEDEETIE